jgi:hypothetical protein
VITHERKRKTQHTKNVKRINTENKKHTKRAQGKNRQRVEGRQGATVWLKELKIMKLLISPITYT